MGVSPPLPLPPAAGARGARAAAPARAAPAALCTFVDIKDMRYNIIKTISSNPRIAKELNT